jgi:hypothetical protein
VAPFIVWQDNDLELNSNEIKGVENDPSQSMYQHFSRSFSALLKYNDDTTVTRELYQILEDKTGSCQFEKIQVFERCA